MHRPVIITIVALGALVGPIGSAFGALTCTFSDGTATVTLASAGDEATIGVQGGAIEVNGSACDAAGVATTERISVLDTSGGSSGVTLDLSGGALAPGLTDEPGDSDEIELDLDLGDGSDQLTVLGGAASDHFAFDELGLNLNAGETSGQDADVTMAGVERTSFSGGGGADRMTNGPAADTFQGGTGFDTVDYSSTALPVTVTVGDGAANDGRSGEGDNVAGDVEHVIGGQGSDDITGDGTAELLVGEGGSDRLAGVGGDDELRGDDGNDILLGGNNDDLLVGGTGDDDERAEAGNDGFNPAVQAHAESYPQRALPDRGLTTTTMGVSGLPTPTWDVNVRIDIEHPSTQHLDIFLISPAGTRTPLSRFRGNGTPFQGTLFDSEAAATINKAGSRTFAGRFHPEGSLEPFRGQNPNGTWGLEIRDNTSGSAGTLNMWRLQFSLPSSSHDGDDVYSGGTGTRDIIDWAGRIQPLTVTMAGGANDGQSGEADDVGTAAGDVEEAYGGNGNDSITGTAAVNDLRGQLGDDVINGLGGNDPIRGGIGVDTIAGGDGNDQLEGGGSGDSINGGPGFDTTAYGRSGTAVTVNIGSGKTSGGEGPDSLTSVENATGSSHGDTLSGSSTNNVLLGGNGSDSLFGLGGNDRLDGQGGTDKADGGAGTDTCLNAESKVSCEV